MSEHVVGLIMALCAALMACNPRVREPAPIGGLSVSWSAADCATAAVDADRDELDDRCELALAQAFAPQLVVDRRDCLWRDDVSPGRLAGGYLFAAKRTPAGVRLAFLPAYYRDCGWSGLACLLRAGSCGAHAGDSEFIAIDVAPGIAPGRWETVGVFLSAHCFGRSDGRCRWYRDDALVDFDWADDVSRGAPQVWVARGKHGHYPSRSSCDRGHWFYDSCDQNRAVVRFPVVSESQNVGSRQVPAARQGCLTSEGLPLGAAGTSPGARECFWNPTQPFWGWQGERRGTAPAPYARYLTTIAAFE